MKDRVTPQLEFKKQELAYLIKRQQELQNTKDTVTQKVDDLILENRHSFEFNLKEKMESISAILGLHARIEMEDAHNFDQIDLDAFDGDETRFKQFTALKA